LKIILLHGEIFEFFHNSSFALRYFLMQMARPQCDTLLLVVVVVAAVLVVVVVYTLPTTSFHCVIPLPLLSSSSSVFRNYLRVCTSDS